MGMSALGIEHLWSAQGQETLGEDCLAQMRA